MTVVKRIKQAAVAAAVVIAFSAMILPAQATPPNEDGEHKVWVCHATDSDTNPWELVHIDIAGWERGHHAQHDLDFDLGEPITGTDADCEGGGTTTTTTTSGDL